MSDRAGTEKNFNRLLKEFRKEVLPQVVDNWDALTENQPTNANFSYEQPFLWSSFISWDGGCSRGVFEKI